MVKPSAPVKTTQGPAPLNVKKPKQAPKPSPAPVPAVQSQMEATVQKTEDYFKSSKAQKDLGKLTRRQAFKQWLTEEVKVHKEKISKIKSDESKTPNERDRLVREEQKAFREKVGNHAADEFIRGYAIRVLKNLDGSAALDSDVLTPLVEVGSERILNAVQGTEIYNDLSKAAWDVVAVGLKENGVDLPAAKPKSTKGVDEGVSKTGSPFVERLKKRVDGFKRKLDRRVAKAFLGKIGLLKSGKKLSEGDIRTNRRLIDAVIRHAPRGFRRRAIRKLIYEIRQEEKQLGRRLTKDELVSLTRQTLRELAADRVAELGQGAMKVAEQKVKAGALKKSMAEVKTLIDEMVQKAQDGEFVDENGKPLKDLLDAIDAATSEIVNDIWAFGYSEGKLDAILDTEYGEYLRQEAEARAEREQAEYAQSYKETQKRRHEFRQAQATAHQEKLSQARKDTRRRVEVTEEKVKIAEDGRPEVIVDSSGRTITRRKDQAGKKLS